MEYDISRWDILSIFAKIFVTVIVYGTIYWGFRKNIKALNWSKKKVIALTLALGTGVMIIFGVVNNYNKKKIIERLEQEHRNKNTLPTN